MVLGRVWNALLKKLVYCHIIQNLWVMAEMSQPLWLNPSSADPVYVPGLDMSLNFYLPDSQNLTFFKTDHVEFRRKLCWRIHCLADSFTCSRQSGSGICQDLYTGIRRSHHYALNALAPNSARPPTGTVLTRKLDMFFSKLFPLSCYIFGHHLKWLNGSHHWSLVIDK